MDSFTSSDWNTTGLKGSGSQKYLGANAMNRTHLIDLSTRSTALKCEVCGRACRHLSEDWHDFLFKQPWTVGQAIAAAAHPQRYTLIGMRCAPCSVTGWGQSRGSGSISFDFSSEQSRTARAIARKQKGQVSFDLIIFDDVIKDSTHG